MSTWSELSAAHTEFDHDSIFRIIIDGIYHAKHGTLSIGASPVHVAVSQAMKNLGNMHLTSSDRSRRMAGVRQRDTEPEIIVRRHLHKSGFRFLLCQKSLPGSPDIVLPKWRTAIFVHGCFWHGHDCHLYKLPATRADWWAKKVADNIERDAKKSKLLAAEGWRVIKVWQCALKGRTKLDPETLDRRLSDVIRGRRRSLNIRGSGGLQTSSSTARRIR